VYQKPEIGLFKKLTSSSNSKKQLQNPENTFVKTPLSFKAPDGVDKSPAFTKSYLLPKIQMLHEHAKITST